MLAQVLLAAVGLWLMAAPDVLGYDDPARANDRIVGPVIVMLGVVAIWEVTRGLRWLALPLATWLLLAPWLLGYDALPAIQSSVAGLLTAGLALIRGRIKQRYGGGWTALLRDATEAAERPHDRG